MAKRRKKMSSFLRITLAAFWLMWSVSAGILFSFGLLAKLNGTGKWSPIILGASMILVGVFTGKWTTETAFALKGGRR